MTSILKRFTSPEPPNPTESSPNLAVNSAARGLGKRLAIGAVAAATIVGMTMPAAFAAQTASATEASVSAPSAADPAATAETQALFAKLQQTQAGELRFGQQHAIDEAISDTATQGDVYEMTGQYPAVFGWDVGLALTGDEKPGVSGNTAAENAKLLADQIVEADKDGAIVTLSAHWNNPATGGNYSDTTTVVADLLPGGAYSGTFNAMLDGIAAVADQSVREDGTQIPIIFRPLHENNGSWFWWGATHASDAEYIELYRYIVDYLRDVKGVHNLMYAYSPGGTFNGAPADYLATYPGDDFVDVLGYDEYDTDNSADNSDGWINTVVTDLSMISDLADEHGKAVALTEFGRSGERAFNESGTGDLDTAFFSELADAIAERVPSVAYMMTWANFGGTGANFQAYTPWKGSDAEADFVKFANSNANLMASADNVDYSTGAATDAAARTASVRLVTPTNGGRLSDDNARDIAVDPETGHRILTVRAKTENLAPENLSLDAPSVAVSYEPADGSDGVSATIPLTYACNGYLVGSLDLDKAGIPLADGGKLALDTAVFTTAGERLGDLNGTVTVKLGSVAASSVANVEDFDSYDSDAELQAVYSPNHSTKANFTLVSSPYDGTQAGNLHYDFDSYPDYNGFQRSYAAKQDWSGYSALQMYLEPDGSDHLFVVQINAGGVTFEAYPDISGTEGGLVTLSFGDADGNGSDFSVASWDTGNAGKSTSQKLLSQVGSFALYVNDNGGDRPRTGNLVIDAVSLTGERDGYVSDAAAVTPADAPVVVDDFSEYDSTADLATAWGNRGHTSVLSLADGPAADGAVFADGNADTPDASFTKAMEFSYDFAEGGWLDIAQYLGGADWSGQQALTMWVRGDGSDNAMAIQIGTTTGRYFLYQLKLDFTGWKYVEVPLVDNAELTQSYPNDANEGSTMTNDDLESIKELVFASSQWNENSDGIDFAVAGLVVKPADADAGDVDGSDADGSDDASDADGDDAADDAAGDVSEGSADAKPSTYADITAADPASCPINAAGTPGSAGTVTGGSSSSNPNSTAGAAGGNVTDNETDEDDNADATGAAQPTNVGTLAATGSAVGLLAAVALACAAMGVGFLLCSRKERGRQ